MRILKLTFLGVIGTIILVISLMNRQFVQFQWNPFGSVSEGQLSGVIEVPLFLFAVIMLSLGLAIGVVLEWRREAQHRSEARRQKSEVERLRAELNRLYQERVE